MELVSVLAGIGLVLVLIGTFVPWLALLLTALVSVLGILMLRLPLPFSRPLADECFVFAVYTGVALILVLIGVVLATFLPRIGAAFAILLAAIGLSLLLTPPPDPDEFLVVEYIVGTVLVGASLSTTLVVWRTLLSQRTDSPAHPPK